MEHQRVRVPESKSHEGDHPTETFWREGRLEDEWEGPVPDYSKSDPLEDGSAFISEYTESFGSTVSQLNINGLVLKRGALFNIRKTPVPGTV